MDPLQALADAIAAFQRNDIPAALDALGNYGSWRDKKGYEPVTSKHHVRGDAIFGALCVLIDSRLYPYDTVDNTDTRRGNGHAQSQSKTS